MNELFHEIHTSERKAWRGCRRRASWRYRDWYQPKKPIKPLEFGIAYHAGMEVLYNPDTWGWARDIVRELAVQRFLDVCEEQRATYELESPQGYLDDESAKDYAERVELGKGMIRYYASLIPEMDRGLTPVKVEISFTVPVTDPVTNVQLRCKCDVCWKRWRTSEEGILHHDGLQVQFDDRLDDYKEVFWQGLPVAYKGRIDCLMRDEYGDYWVYDWKTCARFMQDDSWLYLDDQIASYCWALIQVLGLPIRGFIYHEQYKGYPMAPNENKTTRKGCKFSVSKAQPTDYPTYYKHVEQHDANALASGCYDDFLEWLQSDEGAVFHKRHKIGKTLEELNNVHENIYLEALDLTDPNLKIYPNPSMFGCNWCAYKQPCMGKQRGEDYVYTLDTLFTREPPYYLKPSTDSRGNL